MSNRISSRLTTGSIPRKIEDGRADNPITINIENPTLIEGTLQPFFPPEIVEGVKKHVADLYKNSIREDGVISEKDFEENFFRIDIVEKPSLAKKAKSENRSHTGGLQLVTLSGLPNLVSLGRKRVNHFIQQGKAWRKLLVATELDEKSRYDIRVRVPIATCSLESQIKIYDLDEYYINLNVSAQLFHRNCLGDVLHAEQIVQHVVFVLCINLLFELLPEDHRGPSIRPRNRCGTALYSW